jgi:hypothetical protein
MNLFELRHGVTFPSGWAIRRSVLCLLIGQRQVKDAYSLLSAGCLKVQYTSQSNFLEARLNGAALRRTLSRAECQQQWCK